MALNPILQSMVEQSAQPYVLQQEVERLEADLRLAKAEVKAARLEVRLLTARRIQAETEARALRPAQMQATIRQPVPEPRTIRPADPDVEQLQAELDALDVAGLRVAV